MGWLRRGLAIHHGTARDACLFVARRRSRLETRKQTDGELATGGVPCAGRSVGLMLYSGPRGPMGILRRRSAVLSLCPVWMTLWRGAARTLSGRSTSASPAVLWRWPQALQANTTSPGSALK